MILTFNSLVIDEIEHIIIYLLEIWKYPAINCLFKLFGQFSISASCFWLICRSVCLSVGGGVVLDTSSLWDICIIRSFSISVACFFTIITVYFKNQKSYNYAFYALLVDSLLLTRSWRYSFLFFRFYHFTI